MFKKILSISLSLIMILGLIPISAAGEVGGETTKIGPDFSDMPEDWSTIALENAVSNGLLNGADGKIMPKENLTRAQMAIIINRAFGAEVKEDISNFNDVPNEAWFFDEMAKAVHMKTFMGSNSKLNPNDPITREQAFLVISRALKLKNSGEELEGFNDLDQISEWAKDGVYSLIQKGYVQGSNGNINPKGNITRAEFAQLMDNIIKHYIKEQGEYTEIPEGNIMISVPGVTLKDVTVIGDLIIGDGVGEGDVTLDNVEITGKMIVRGGGENSILIKGNSKIKEITVAKVDGRIRVYAEDGTEIETVYVDDGKDKVMLQGRFNSVVIQTDTEISIDNAKIDKITLQSPKSNITVGETSTVENIEIEKEAEESSVKIEGTVTTLTTSAPNTKVEGEGTLDTINAEEGSDDSVFTVPDSKVTAEADVLVNETEVKAGEEATINDEGTDIVVEEQTTSSGSSSGSSSVDVTGITLDKTSITIKLGQGTETITPTISPSNASNKSVNWESSDETVATVSAGVVSPVSDGNTTITAVTVDGGYEAICEVNVTPEDPDIINFSGTYDGLAHSIEVTNKISGDTVHYSTDGGTTWSTTNPEFIDVGNYQIDVKVKNTSFEDRTSSGTVTITKRDISITASSGNKVYDGSGLTNDNYSITDGTLAANQTLDSVTVTGSQTEVGISLNVPSGAVIRDDSSNNVTENYNITYINGTLEVTKATGDDLIINEYSNFYDGLAHSISVDNTIPGDIVYYSIDGGTTWTTTNPEYTEALIDGYRVDVKVENPNYENRLGQGIVQIMPQMLMIKADSSTKVYDGTELTENGYTYIGTIALNQAIDSATVTGSQKYVGSSDNIPSGAVITDDSSNDVTSNYSISYINGTLTVTQANINITVIANSDTKEYDGTPLTNSGFTVTEGSLLPGDYIEADITGSITEVGTTNNIISNITVKNNGVDVTENYYITSLNGTLNVTEPTYVLTLAANPEIGGTVIDNTNSGPYTNNELVNVSAVPNVGYEFVNWKYNGMPYSNSPTFNYTMAPTDHTLIAYFQKINITPVAMNDSVIVDEDETIQINVLVNDSDLDGDQIRISNYDNQSWNGGTVTKIDNEFSYQPPLNFYGNDSFTYEITDDKGGTATAKVSITVNPVNDVPVAVDDSVSVDEDGTILVGVLANDSDIDGDTLSITGFTQGTNGTVAQEGDSLRYTPDANYTGANSFTYDISDGNGGVAMATVSITINPVNDLPVATDDSASVDEDSTILIDVLVNDTDIDGDILSITGFTQGTNVTVAQEGDSLRYTPDANYTGADSFTYDISDGNGGVATATVSVTINPVNDLPVATDDSASVDEDSTILIDVLINDTDIDGDTLSITGFTQGTNGTVAQEGDNLRYTPDANYYGSDSFTYDISDGNGGAATTTVNVTVNSTSILSIDIEETSWSTDLIEINIIESGNYDFITSFYMEGQDTIIYLYDSTGINQIAVNDDYVDLYGAIVGQYLDPGIYNVVVENFDINNLRCHLEIVKN